MSTGRKVFHCAVDETALTTNISEIKKWTTNGAIDLIVPLYSKLFPSALISHYFFEGSKAFARPSLNRLGPC